MTKRNHIKGAEALLLSLIAEGVDTIFGYPGGSVIPIYDELYNYKNKINHILTRHEQGAVHAAQGYARATGKTGVCMATSGPGATNLLTGIADAMLDSTPLVCITGQVASAQLGSDAFQEADIISITMPITKWNYQVTSAREIPEALAKAFYIARSGRPGPVVIDFTKNAQIETFDFEYEPCTSLRCYTPAPILDRKKIREATELINHAEKPLILAGQGIKLSGAEKALAEFAEKANIPVASTLMGLSAIPNDHPLYVGKLGMHGNVAPNTMTQESDLLIAVGMRFSDRVTGDVSAYAPKAKIIHIEIDAAEIDKVIKADVALLADAKEALRALSGLVKKKERDAWMQFAREKYREEYESVIKPSLFPESGPIKMGEVINRIAEISAGNAVIVTDVGQQQMFSSRYSKFTATRSFITSGGLGTMGFGLPAAIGAKMGVPDRQVIAVLGDGGFQMTMQELGTIMQNRIPVKIVILDNSFLGMVRQWQQLFFDKRYSFTELENPNFCLIAEAYGIPAETVTERADLQPAIKRMLQSDKAYILAIGVEREDNVFPMIPAGVSISNLLYNE